VIWIGNLILAWNYIVLETVKTVARIAQHAAIDLPTFSPPEMFWYIWGGLVAGYIFSRTGDKFMGGKGGSFNLGPIKLESKGD
jgi:membrane protease YdiL (CAAX protease family)